MSEPLPWDLYTPDEPTPEPPPVIPPTPIVLPEIPPGPPRPPSPDVGDLAHDLLNEAMSYAKQAIDEIRKGQTVDVLHPTITATDVSGRELVVADARNRSWRTFLQGLIFDLLAGLVAAIAVLSGADPFVRDTWVAFGVLLLKTFVSAGISYVMRLKATPTIRTKGPEIALMPLPRPVLNEENNERMHA